MGHGARFPQATIGLICHHDSTTRIQLPPSPRLMRSAKMAICSCRSSLPSRARMPMRRLYSTPSDRAPRATPISAPSGNHHRAREGRPRPHNGNDRLARRRADGPRVNDAELLKRYRNIEGDEDLSLSFVEERSEEQTLIGFWHFYDTGEEYLQAIVERAETRA